MLTAAFFLAFTVWILQGICFPSLSIFAFLPFLSLVILRCSLPKTLWLAAFVGALQDLLSDDPMGLHALNAVLTATIFWRARSHFSYDTPLHLSLFTGLASSFSTLLQVVLLFLFDRRVPFHGKWVLADAVGMPILDALYAFVWFSAPFALFRYIRKIGMVFWLKRKTLFRT